mmetsp:Transcript_34952/g.104617  ORF Transcript_34952/g.104617 Transcript_34952/m.104617 type:complete len:217 (+) Transcript_34952:816-1466(+)
MRSRASWPASPARPSTRSSRLAARRAPACRPCWRPLSPACRPRQARQTSPSRRCCLTPTTTTSGVSCCWSPPATASSSVAAASTAPTAGVHTRWRSWGSFTRSPGRWSGCAAARSASSPSARGTSAASAWGRRSGPTGRRSRACRSRVSGPHSRWSTRASSQRPWGMARSWRPPCSGSSSPTPPWRRSETFRPCLALASAVAFWGSCTSTSSGSVC